MQDFVYGMAASVAVNILAGFVDPQGRLLTDRILGVVVVFKETVSVHYLTKCSHTNVGQILILKFKLCDDDILIWRRTAGWTVMTRSLALLSPTNPAMLGQLRSRRARHISALPGTSEMKLIASP